MKNFNQMIDITGVRVENHSRCEPLVLLKHFPAHPGVPGESNHHS